MRAGELRHRIIIEQNTPTRDAFGAEVPGWAALDTVWAAINPRWAMERFLSGAGQTVAQRSTVFVIRYRGGLDTKMRVTWDGKTYNLRQILETNSRRRELALLGEEINP
jgi:SPP1 family predicted phage head-tail adaptor